MNGLFNMMQAQQEFKKELSEQNENNAPLPPIVSNSTSPNKSSSLETVWSSSTLIGNSNTDNTSYASIDNNKTITETINYAQIKTINQEKEKISISPESIESLRSTELEKIRPNPIKRFLWILRFFSRGYFQRSIKKHDSDKSSRGGYYTQRTKYQ